MRKPHKKGVKITEGAWVGISPRCRTSVVDDYGFTEGQIQRLRAGNFVAVEEDGDVWLCWDVHGRDVHIRVPKRVLRSFSEVDFKYLQEEPLGPCPGALVQGDAPVDPRESLASFWDVI